MVYPWSPGPVTSGKSCSRDARYSAGPLLALWVGWWLRRAFDRCVRGARSQKGGRGGILRGGVRGAACCGLELRRVEVHMMLRVLRVFELQL